MALVAPDASGPDADQEDEVMHVVLPPAGHLAAAWESDPLLRQQMRDFSRLLQWPSKVSIGVASQAALVLNRTAIKTVVSEWSMVCSEPKSVPIGWIRDEVPYQGLHAAQKHGIV